MDRDFKDCEEGLTSGLNFYRLVALRLQRKTRAVVLPEHLHQIRHDFRQGLVQGPRRVDDEHPAAVHA